MEVAKNFRCFEQLFEKGSKPPKFISTNVQFTKHLALSTHHYTKEKHILPNQKAHTFQWEIIKMIRKKTHSTIQMEFNQKSFLKIGQCMFCLSFDFTGEKVCVRNIIYLLI